MAVSDRPGRRLPLSGRRVGQPVTDPARVLRRRRSPLQLALVGLLIVLLAVIEVIVVRAYANVSRTTATFGQATYLTGNLINVQRELLLLQVEVTRLPAGGDLRRVQVRRALLGNQLRVLDGTGAGDPLVATATGALGKDLLLLDRALARARARPTPARLRAEAARAGPVLRGMELRVKELYDHEEQGFYGAVEDALHARVSSQRLLIGLSALVVLVGAALALSLRQRVRSDFARAWHALIAEVEERKAAEAALRGSEERFRSLVQNSSDVITILDADRGIRYHSESVRRVLGYEPTELIDADAVMMVHPDDRERAIRFVAEATLRPGVTGPATWRVRHRDGSWLHSETVAANLLDDPNVRGLVLNTRDVSERKELEDRLVQQAFYDGLTGLANRTLFAERVEQALAAKGAGPSRGGRDGPAGDVAVLFIDLDDFKHVNDSLGHAAGDQLLVVAAKRLQSCLRPTDTAARLGGDEFAILLEPVVDPDAGAAVASRILDTLHRPFGLGGRTIPIRASVGVAVGRPGECVADELLRNADVAMYAAKTGGKDRHQLFQPDMHADVLQRLELEADLRHAVDRGELVLHYQPIVDLRSGRVTGVEALVRWAHPTRGLLLPAAFVPLAEEQGMIGPIGRWVLEEACRQARRWQDQLPDRPALVMHVNLSGRQLHQELTGEVAHALTASGLDAGLLCLEITETVLMADTDAAADRLRDLKGLGVRLAIDDFGTGYSSLNYLRRFPIDTLKIDKAFVDGIGMGSEDAAVAQAILNLSQTLHLQAIAEGIERPEQAAHLVAYGCHNGQGFHFSRPLAAAALGRLLRELHSDGGFPPPTPPAASQSQAVPA